MVLADALFPSPIFRPPNRLNLLQRGDNLRLCVPASAHPPYLFLRPNRIPNLMDSGGQVKPAKVISILGPSHPLFLDKDREYPDH